MEGADAYTCIFYSNPSIWGYNINMCYVVYQNSLLVYLVQPLLTKWFLFQTFQAITSNIRGLKANISHVRTWGIPKSDDCFGFVFSDCGLISLIFYFYLYLANILHLNAIHLLFFHIKIHKDWVGIVKSISGNIGGEKALARRLTNFWGFWS